MFKTEKDFRDRIVELLEKDDYDVQKEFRIPEGYRVDVLAKKDETMMGIEVKYERYGISNDIMKCYELHKFPEFDEMYVAAPRILISSDHEEHAKELRIGIIGVTEDSIYWLVKSQRLKQAVFSGSLSLSNQATSLGQTFTVSREVRNAGEKVARSVEMYVIPGGPFSRKGRTKFRRVKLDPNDSWSETFEVYVKKNARTGKYPLSLASAAQNVKPHFMTTEIQIT